MDEILLFARDFLAATKSPLAPKVEEKIRLNKWSEISGLMESPSTYTDPVSFFRDYQAVSAFRKLNVESQTARLKNEAKVEWFRNEKHCFWTNTRLNPYLDRFGNREDAIEKFLSLVKKHVGSFIGWGPGSSQIHGRFGPGTTMEHKGARCLIPDKLVSIPSMTANAFPFAHLFLLTEQTWIRNTQDKLFEGVVPQGTFSLVRGNRWTSVPKDATKERSIGIEPTMNLWYQLGVGGLMKKRLQKRGLLLDGGKSEILHRRLAKEASVGNHLATIDCSSASDTISLSLVRLVTPPGWLELLEGLRSPNTIIDSKPIRLEKFSSMGNGFTFELETAIFAGIACAVAEIHNVSLDPDCFSVYGDDIIVPVTIDTLLRKALVFFGFIVNDKKSYAYGPFRESCGGDFFLGYEVRPVFFKDIPRCPAEWIGWLNRVYSLIDHLPEMKNVWEKWRKKVIPRQYADCCGPRSLGDIVLHTPPSEWLTRRMLSEKEHLPNDWMAIRALVPQPALLPLERWDEQTAVTASIYGCSSNGVAPRNSIRGYRKSWVAYG